MDSIVLKAFALLFVACAVQTATVKVNTVSQGWTNKKADIYFVMDSSSSIWILDYRDMLTFVSDMVSGMDIGPNKTRVGVGLFSDKFKEFLPLNNGRSKENLVDAIQDTPYVSGNGYISRAIEGVRRKGLSAEVTRKGVPLIAVIFTDGESRHHQLTIDNSTLAKKEGIFIYTVGVGRGVDKLELHNIASDPKDNYAFWVPNFAAFGTVRQTLMKSMSEVEFLQGDEGTCGKKDVVDVLFVFDEFALGQTNATAVKSFIKSLVKEFSMDSGNMRIGIVSKTCHHGDTSLGQYLTQADLLAHIEDQTGPTVSSLLRRARNDGFLPEVGGRNHAQKRIVLVLQGKASDEFSLRDLVEEASRARFSGIEIFILPIETEMEKDVLDKMASKPSYITYVDSIRHLYRKKTQFLEAFCRELN